MACNSGATVHDILHTVDGIEHKEWVCALRCQSGSSSAGPENSAESVAPIPLRDDKNEGPGEILCLVATNGQGRGTGGKPI